MRVNVVLLSALTLLVPLVDLLANTMIVGQCHKAATLVATRTSWIKEYLSSPWNSVTSQEYYIGIYLGNLILIHY